MAFRAWVAAQRHLGMEMDLRKLADHEEETLRLVIRWWKSNRDWLSRATIHRLDAPDPAVTAEVQISDDGRRFVLFAAQTGTSRQSLPLPVLLSGLSLEARYRLRLVNPEDAPPQSRGTPALKMGALELSGHALMTRGIRLPLAWPGTMWVVEGELPTR
jgi:alpha-galactosidase